MGSCGGCGKWWCSENERRPCPCPGCSDAVKRETARLKDLRDQLNWFLNLSEADPIQDRDQVDQLLEWVNLHSEVWQLFNTAYSKLKKIHIDWEPK